MRVVRFYQSCPCSSPPPPSPPPPLPPVPCSLPPCQLFAKLFANFRTQWGMVDLKCKGPERTGHRWTSTWDPPAQWAPLDLPSSLTPLTSTWDPPSSVSTAGPQRPYRMPQGVPDRTPDSMSDRMPEDMPDKMPKDMPDRVPEDMPDCQIEC